MQVHLHEGVDLRDRLTSALRFRTSNVTVPMNDLALQVRFVDDVKLDDAEGAYTCCREIHQRRRSEATRPNTQHPGVLQALLTVHPHVGDDEVAAVSANLVHGEVTSRRNQWRQTHGISSIQPSCLTCQRRLATPR